jgi:hypothetical protein
VGGGQSDFVAFDCTSQEKAAHGHVVYAVQEAPFWAPFDAVFDTFCPGNERCAVKPLPVRCLFRVSPPDRASPATHRFATLKVPFPSSTTLTAFYPLLYFVTALCPPP